jgi:hypothetical protein
MYGAGFQLKPLQTKAVGDTTLNPMNKDIYRRMKVGMKRRGCIVREATPDEIKYLDFMGAEAVYSEGLIIHRGGIPAASALFEEIIHFAQDKKYGKLKTSDMVEVCAREIEANRKLLKHTKAYGLDEFDLEDTKANLRYWEKRFVAETGESYDKSDYSKRV